MGYVGYDLSCSIAYHFGKSNFNEMKNEFKKKNGRELTEEEAAELAFGDLSEDDFSGIEKELDQHCNELEKEYSKYLQVSKLSDIELQNWAKSEYEWAESLSGIAIKDVDIDATRKQIALELLLAEDDLDCFYESGKIIASYYKSKFSSVTK